MKSVGLLRVLQMKSTAPSSDRPALTSIFFLTRFGIKYNSLWYNSIEVFDVYGRKQNVEFHSYGLTILQSYGLSHLPAGGYFLKVGNEVKRVVKL